MPALPAAALAKSVPGDAALPIAELMPLTMRYEADLKLTPEQIKAITAYREANMPKRIAGQKNILALRGQLRAAMLSGQPTGDLMRQVSQAELDHMQARERCVVFMRTTLTPEQYTQLIQRYIFMFCHLSIFCSLLQHYLISLFCRTFSIPSFQRRDKKLP